MIKKLFYFLSVATLTLSGCKNLDDYREERVEKADRAFKQIKKNKFPEDAILSLPYCIELALKNNLDLKVYELKEAVDKEKKTAAMLGMLPDLMITNDLTYRTNEPGAKSVYLTGPQAGQQSLAYSKSTNPFENRVRAELLFSAIDFGLALCTYIQQDDKKILTSEQRRRAAQNLILDVTRAYLRVAAAQYAMETTEKMINLSIETEELLQEMAKHKTVPLVSVLEENKKFIVLKKSLMEYKRSYQNSCIELRSLMGYYPTHEIKVDTSAMDELTELPVPDIELLEEAALIERPELYQLDIQKHITTMEARKTIITMFPNVQLFLDFTNSTNPYLYHMSWYEMGARAAYNLLKLPQRMEQYFALDAETDQIQAQTVALSVGIIAQVRIAHANLIEVKDRYELAEDLYEVYKKHEDVAEIHANSAGDLSKIDLSRVKIESAQRAIERTQALGNYYLAYFRLLNAVGLESFDKTELEKLKKRIEANINDSIENVIDDIADYKEEIAEVQTDIDNCTAKLNDLQLAMTNTQDKINSAETQLNSLGSDSELNKLNEQYTEKRSVLEKVLAMENENLKRLESSEDTENKETEISSCKEKILIVEERLNDLESEHADALENISNSIDDKTSDLKEIITESIEQLAEYNDDIKTYQDHIQKLETEKAELIQKLNSSEANKQSHYSKIDKYNTEIDKMIREETKDKTKKENLLLNHYDKVMDLGGSSDGQHTTDNRQQAVLPHGTMPKVGQETVADHAGQSISNLNMEMQQQSGSKGDPNTISSEEYIPGKANSIIIEAQKNAANNTIGQEQFNPMTQDGITMEMMKDTDRDQITPESYNVNQDSGLANEVMTQMNNSTIQPGRNGN